MLAALATFSGVALGKLSSPLSTNSDRFVNGLLSSATQESRLVKAAMTAFAGPLQRWGLFRETDEHNSHAHASLYRSNHRLPSDQSYSALKRFRNSKNESGEGRRSRQDPQLEGAGMLHWASGKAFRQGKLITGSTSHRMLLFTFDDGPDLNNTPRLLDKLNDYGVKAIFFVNGERVDTQSRRGRARVRLLKRIVAEGHMVGNHTYSHKELPALLDGEVVDEILRTQRLFREHLGMRSWVFRPPGGAISPRVSKIIAELGYTTVLWNLGTGDFQVKSSDAVFQTWKKVLSRRWREFGDRGGIVLLHDTHEWSIDAVDRIMREIWARNCRLLQHEDEELYDVVDDLTFFYEPLDGSANNPVALPAVIPDEVLRLRQRQLRDKEHKRCADQPAR